MANLSQITRDMINRTIKDQVYRRMGFLDELMSRDRIITSGGLTIGGIADYGEVDDLAQSYVMNQQMTDGEKTTLVKPTWNWKYTQMPLKYGGDVEIQNINAGNEEQLVDLATYLAKKAQRGIKIKLEKMIANGGGTTTTDYNDTGVNFQSLIHALKHTTTSENYGALARSGTSGVRNWWQGADQGNGADTQLLPTIAEGTGFTSYQGTATTLSIATLRKLIIPVQHNIQAKKDLMVIACPTLYNKLKAECQAQMIYQGSTETANVGFNKMFIDGHQIVDWDYLEESSTMKTWLFILNLETWELHFNKARNFKMTPFKWAGELPNGMDYYLARILLAGNLICNQPNANLWLSNVS